MVNSSDTLRDAARWVARLQGEHHPPGEEAAFRAWLAQSEAHRDAFELATDTWDVVGSARPEGVIASQEAARTGANRRKVLGGVLLAGGMLAAGGIMLSQPAMARTIVTGVGERRRVMLSDRTVVDLDVCSRLEVALSGHARMIRLQSGRANIRVASDPAGPLTIRLGEYTVLSQRSCLDLACCADRLASVMVIEGAARIARGGEAPIVLTPGRRLMDEGRGMALDRPDVTRVSSWQQGYVFFDDELLENAARRMNEYSTTRIILADNNAGQMRVSGRFEGRDTEGFVRALSLLLPVTSQRAGDGFVISSTEG